LGREKIPLLSQEGKAREARRGGSKAQTFRNGNHPSRDPLRDPAALLTQEGNPLLSRFPIIIVIDGNTNDQLVR
jgi:hypothetical protein